MMGAQPFTQQYLNLEHRLADCQHNILTTLATELQFLQSWKGLSSSFLDL